MNHDAGHQTKLLWQVPTVIGKIIFSQQSGSCGSRNHESKGWVVSWPTKQIALRNISFQNSCGLLLLYHALNIYWSESWNYWASSYFSAALHCLISSLHAYLFDWRVMHVLWCILNVSIVLMECRTDVAKVTPLWRLRVCSFTDWPGVATINFLFSALNK